MSRTRRIVLTVLAVMFFGLAVASAVQGAPLFIPPLWAVSGIVLLLVVRKTGGLRSDRPKPPSSASDPARRARRSGNPAIRAGVEPPTKP